jgi:hypothetical protein
MMHGDSKLFVTIPSVEGGKGSNEILDNEGDASDSAILLTSEDIEREMDQKNSSRGCNAEPLTPKGCKTKVKRHKVPPPGQYPGNFSPYQMSPRQPNFHALPRCHARYFSFTGLFMNLIYVILDFPRRDDVRKIIDGLALEFKSVYFPENGADSPSHHPIHESNLTVLGPGRRKRRPGQIMQSSDFILCSEYQARKCPRRSADLGRGSRVVPYAHASPPPTMGADPLGRADDAGESRGPQPEERCDAASRAASLDEESAPSAPSFPAAAALGEAIVSCALPAGAAAPSAYFDEVAAATAAAR